MIMYANETPEFGTWNIPVKNNAKSMGMRRHESSPKSSVVGSQSDTLRLTGKLVKGLDGIRFDRCIDYTIEPKIFWQATGYMRKG